MYKRTYNPMLINVLENTHSIAIMIYLLKNPDSSKMELYQAVSNTTRMRYKLDDLERAGLLKQYSVGASTRLNLTEVGTDVAKKLNAVERILSKAERENAPQMSG